MQPLNMELKSIMESKLRDVLQPVAPDPAFVHQLEHKLSRSSNVLLEDQNNKKVILLLGFSLFFGALLVWLLGKLQTLNLELF